MKRCLLALLLGVLGGVPVMAKDVVYFAATESTQYKRQLWVTDGTAAGTFMVSNHGYVMDFADSFTDYLGFGLYFRATYGNLGTQLWLGGALAGSMSRCPINDVCVNPLGGLDRPFPRCMWGANGMFFTANDGVHGYELYVADGVSVYGPHNGNPQLDLNPGPGGSYPDNFTICNNMVLFTANNGTSGYELWRVDMNAPTMVKDIYFGQSSSSIANMITMGGVLYFTATDGIYGNELWRSDGTSAGTVMVKDINPLASSAFALPPAEPTPKPPSCLRIYKNKLFFAAQDNTGNDLWCSNGTAAGTYKVKSGCSNAGNFYEMNGILYFAATMTSGDRELWRTDGTTAGTYVVKDIFAGVGASKPADFIAMNGVLYFTAEQAYKDRELYRSDGTAGGTYLVKDVYAGVGASNPGDFCVVNGILYFSAEQAYGDRELWRTNGTAAGTYLVKDIYSGVGASNPKNLTNLNGKLLFSANNYTNGRELWLSNGTSAGTVMLKDIYAGFTGSNPGFHAGLNAQYPKNPQVFFLQHNISQ